VRRRLFTVAWVVSLLFAVAVAGLWARSYFAVDTVYLSGADATAAVWSMAGSIRATNNALERPWKITHYSQGVSADGIGLSSLAAFGLDSKVGIRVDWHLVLPHWALLVAALVLPTIAAVRRHRAGTGFPVEPPAPSSPPRV
jgi:hypothetical protein